MRIKDISTGFIASLTLLASASLSAAVDPSAEVIKVKKDCTAGGTQLDNCFTTMGDLQSWISNTRKPGAGNPLRVEIGPGRFAEKITIQCNAGSGYTGHTVYHGSGRGQTVFEGVDYNSPIVVSDCTNLTFSDFKITTDFYGGVEWMGGGDSRWENIDIDGKGRAWYEPQCGTESGSHYWFSSKLEVTAFVTIATAYQAGCDETWFFGSEVKSTIPSGESSGLTHHSVVQAFDDGIIHLYGSNIRSINHGSGVVPAAAAGIGPSGPNNSGGEIHIHGTGIDAISSNGGDVAALHANNNGFIHADVSAYVMKTTGTKSRIINNGGTVKAPYQWTPDDQPPQVITENGADIFVETNCDQGACHDENTGTETHLLIYNNNCDFAGHGPWFDVVTGKCRGDIN